MNETIGQRILRLRKSKGLTQEQLAEKVGVTAQAVSKWENDVSLPDIQIIPALSGILGVSTDALLGVTACPNCEAAVDKNEDDPGLHLHVNGSNKGWIFFAVMLILAGAYYILAVNGLLPAGDSISIWSVLWPAAVFGAGVSMMIGHFSVFSLGVSLCGTYYLLYNCGIITWKLSWSIVLAALVILLGFSIILDKTLFRSKKGKCHGFASAKTKVDADENDGCARMSCSFGSCSQDVQSGVFRHADASVSFGEGKLYLTGCLTADTGAQINARVSFGELEIHCPRRFRIIPSAGKSFASIETEGEPYPDAQYAISLDGNVSFGAISILYE